MELNNIIIAANEVAPPETINATTTQPPSLASRFLRSHSDDVTRISRPVRTTDPEHPAARLSRRSTSATTTSDSDKSIFNRPNILQRMISRLSVISEVPTSPITLRHGAHFLTNVTNNAMSRREVAEIQLYAILNDPEESLPIFARSAHVLSINEVAKQLNTPPFIIERLLNVIHSLSKGEDDASLTSQQNVVNLTRVLNSTLDVRILLFFMILDENADNRITKEEMSGWLLLYLKSIAIDTSNLQEAVQALVQRFYSDRLEYQIDFDEFHSIITKDETILQVFSRFAVNPTWFVVPLVDTQSKVDQQCCYPTCYNRHKSKLTPKYFNDNLSNIMLLSLYILTNLGLALYVTIYRSTVRKDKVFLILARISGMLLNFNCVLTVILMLKQTILYIRSKMWLRRYIPVDDHIDFHKFVGRFIALLAIVHSIAHMINFSQNRDYGWATLMFTTIPKIGWVGGSASLSGIILLIALAIIVIFSMDWMRHRGLFWVFYWTHRVYPLFFIFLIIHAKNFWKWSIGPLTWFFLEKIYSIYSRFSSSNGRTVLNSATIEQSNVISLSIKRPAHFRFRAGDYININLPRVALHEFHPFTISSAPEEKDVLRVHIQATGHWTKRVYKRFKEMSESHVDTEQTIKVFRADQDAEQAAADYRRCQDSLEAERESSQKPEVVIINGPYSSCARYIFDCKHVVLISGGIGVTPYASILSSLMAQFRASRRVCQHCQHTNYEHEIVLENHRIRKVDFIWVSRDYKSFEWFLNLLNQFEEEQEAYLATHLNEQRFLTIHLYFTTVKTDDYIGYHPLQLITQVWAQVTGKDVFTGLKAQTHIGRPSWNKIFTELRSGENASEANDVSVFFCGSAVMGQTIRECCINHSYRYYEEKF